MTTPPRRLAVAAVATAQPVTPLTATALQYQWTQLPAAADPTDAELKQRLSDAARLSITPVPEEDDEDDALLQAQAEEPKPVAWQSARDLPDRRAMVQRILALTEKRNRTALPPPPPGQPTAPLTPVQAFLTAQAAPTSRRPSLPAATSASEGATALAKRIELSLYSRAGSLDEYRNTMTLRRRLQSLVSLSFHEAAASRASPIVEPTPLRSGGKRSRPSATTTTHKRRRVLAVQSVTTASSATGSVLGSLPEDCIRAVFSFLDGRQVMSLRCLNRYAAHVLLSCVVTLDVEISKLHAYFVSDPSCSMLIRMVNLERLVVYRTTNPCAAPTTPDQKLALHAWGCAELDVSHNNLGEIVVSQLATALTLGAGARLRRLQIVSAFTNTSRRNGLRALCYALSRGACPVLNDLLLGGNSITDAGAADVARLLEARTLPLLMRLDLRRNYIGECGLRRLMVALGNASTPLKRLKYLCLGGNLITDNCVSPLQEVLARGACPQMRFLGLEDNFLSPEGVQSIIQSAVSGGMVPKLHRVSSDGGIMTE